jgi:hypothetical protein
MAEYAYFSPVTGADTVAGSERYSGIASISSDIRYPINNDGYAMPMVRFDFFDPGGAQRSAPLVHLQLPEQFRTNHTNNYQESQYIFPGSGIFNTIKNAVSGPPAEEGSEAQAQMNASAQSMSAANAFEYMLSRGGANFSGFINSGGMSGIDQYEFNKRQFVNQLQQLLYKGPTYRQFQMPFLMRPRNYDEARNITSAISMMKIAAATSPATELSISFSDILDTGIDGFDVEGGLNDIPFTFEYPDLVRFTILVQNSTGGLQQLFQSKLCAIVDLNVQYGAQRINFVEGPNNKMFPTETGMDITLKEVEFNTAKDYIDEASDSNRTIR